MDYLLRSEGLAGVAIRPFLINFPPFSWFEAVSMPGASVPLATPGITGITNGQMFV